MFDPSYENEIEAEELEVEPLEKLKRAVIKQELVELTGDFQKAVILNQLIYWSERIKDFDKFIAEEKRIAKEIGQNVTIEPKRGWIYKKAEELAEETMLNLSAPGMMNHIKKLVEKGWISQRRNPKNKMDKTYQYRVNLTKIQLDLLQMGYALEGYKVGLDFVLEAAALIRSKNILVREQENLDRSKASAGRSKNSTDRSKNILVGNKADDSLGKENEDRSEECLQQYQRSLTETSVESTVEITSDQTHDPNPSIAEFDKAIKSTMKGRLDSASYETWFADTSLIAISDGIAFLRTPTSFQANWITTHYLSQIQECLIRAGAPVREVRVFVTNTEEGQGRVSGEGMN